MALELEKAELLALHRGRRKDDGVLHPAQVSFGKLNNLREAISIARQARTILGADGITLDHPVMNRSPACRPIADRQSQDAP
jgi:glutaryl-CoA dehydrogenase